MADGSTLKSNLHRRAFKRNEPGSMTMILFRRMYSVLAAVCCFSISVTCASGADTESELADRVDQHLAARWRETNVTSALPADEATYLRRVYLDVIGRIPTAGEARQFLDDDRSDKRRQLADRLLHSAAHARHVATVWRREWIPQADLPQSFYAHEIEIWLSSQFRDGVGVDQIVRGLLTATPTEIGIGAPTTFLSASEFKPENLAANSARAFLGLNLDCAQCHDHPFALWTRDQFWETAAFFSRPTTSETQPVTLMIAIPGLNRSVSPRFLTGASPTLPFEQRDNVGRKTFASWITSKQNPYFTRNLANRTWAQLFGVGLIEPLDDLNHENPASHPQLLDELAKFLAEHQFDLSKLTASLLSTHAYQLSSLSSSPETVDERLYQRSSVRGLTGEQLYDSLSTAAGLRVESTSLDPHSSLRERTHFAEKFRIDRASHAQRSILQSLSMMNGSLTSQLTNVDQTPTLRAVAQTPFLDTKGRVESLFLATLSRFPSDDELDKCVAYVDQPRPADTAAARLADIFWALLNSAEFCTNH